MNYLKTVRKANKVFDEVVELANYPVSHEQLGGFDYWHKDKPIVKYDPKV